MNKSNKLQKRYLYSINQSNYIHIEFQSTIMLMLKKSLCRPPCIHFWNINTSRLGIVLKWTHEKCKSCLSLVYFSTFVFSNRRPSLKEMPSYRDEASKALNRREELTRLKDRLSSGKHFLYHSVDSGRHG